MADLLKVSILGTMPSGEEWSVNPVWRLNAQPVSVDFTDALTIATAVDGITIPSSLLALMSSSTAVTGCRVEARDNNGDLDALAEHTRTTPITGGGPDPHPFQTSVVVSLRSPLAGPSGRGRLYWPGTGASLSSGTLRFDSVAQAAALTGFKTYLNAITAAITATVPDAILAVWSRKLNTTLGVNRIIVGDVLDTQRRRRDVVPESYLQTTFP